MKMREFREMSDQQLADTLRDTYRQLFLLRLRSATEKQSTPSELIKLRRDVARMKTLQREREITSAKA